jgi:hypothetical protein
MFINEKRILNGKIVSPNSTFRNLNQWEYLITKKCSSMRKNYINGKIVSPNSTFRNLFNGKILSPKSKGTVQESQNLIDVSYSTK